jgi:cytochrome P450
MFAVVVVLIGFLICYLAYSLYFLPKAEMQRVAKMLRDMGYKVNLYPYSLLKIQFVEEEKIMLATKGDVKYKLKHDYIGTDFSISNLFNSIIIVVTNPEIMKELFTPDKVDIHHKLGVFFRGMTTLIGEGLIFSEGDGWKRKRKITSKLFTFDILLHNIDKISQICDRVLD